MSSTGSPHSYTVTSSWVFRNKRFITVTKLNPCTQAAGAYGSALAVLMGNSIRYFIKLVLFNDAVGIETI
jgi:hypothetical protein